MNAATKTDRWIKGFTRLSFFRGVGGDNGGERREVVGEVPGKSDGSATASSELKAA
jgi:hypothetical protein